MADDGGRSTYPSDLADAERAAILHRREKAASAKKPFDVAIGENGLPIDTVGVAFSGGGIRSATFCLGVLRALARLGLLGRIDFLSTVSGGGYLGCFLGGLFNPRPRPEKPPTVDSVASDLLDLRSDPVDWLRENGRYMSPNGAGDTLLAGAILLRNWVAVNVVISLFLFTLFACSAWLAAIAPAQVGGAAGAAAWSIGPAKIQLVLSPYLALAGILLLLAAIPLGWAYWYTQRVGFPSFLFAVAALAALLLPSWRSLSEGRLLGIAAAAALVWWAVAEAVAGRRGPREQLARNRLSRWLSDGLWTAAAILAFGLVDSFGRTVATNAAKPAELWRTCVWVGAGLAAVLTAVQKAAPVFKALSGQKRLSLTPQLLAGGAATIVGLALLMAIAVVVHAIPLPRGQVAAYGVLVTLAATWTIPFLNLSSHNSLYGARLTRAYLGASNLTRRATQTTVTELLPDDRIPLAQYDPPAAGGPLHLINVTVNETVSGKSQIEQRDRKGLGMAIGPCGVSVGRRHHAEWEDGARGRTLVAIPTPEYRDDFNVFPSQAGSRIEVEDLDLGTWISISGAAFTTGLGARTSLALSLLLGLSNVRLGHWWDCGITPSDRRRAGKPLRETPSAKMGRWFSEIMPVHAYLLDELLARFHGPARRRWYLSDGGHSENTGAYELIRRRVPFILMCDAGCDPGYTFADLANLARRVRTDFKAELAVLGAQQLDDLLPPDLRPLFGTVRDFDPKGAGPRPHALLAAVFYDDPKRKRDAGSVVLILKPSLCGDEPVDVTEYRSEHDSFPQEPTTDQFFDEAQWESYRRLGEHVASRVLVAGEKGGMWQPLDFGRPPVERLSWPGTSLRGADSPVGGTEARVRRAGAGAPGRQAPEARKRPAMKRRGDPRP